MKVNFISQHYWADKYFDGAENSILINEFFSIEFDYDEAFLYPLHSNYGDFFRLRNVLCDQGKKVHGASKEELNFLASKSSLREDAKNIIFPEFTWSYDEALEWVESGAIVISKRDGGTKGKGIEIGCNPNSDFYEKFLPGEEFSVNVICLYGVLNILPIVYKQSNSLDLIHPSLRRRTIANKKDSMNLCNITSNYLAELPSFLIAELEYIKHKGEYYLIEINPRISGTLKTSLNYLNTNLNSLSGGL